jgi:hypothetical protein
VTAFLILWLCECVNSCVVYLPGFTVRGDIGWVVVLEPICCVVLWLGSP